MSEEICDGVKILCERMENNPEDFMESDFDPSTMYRNLGKFYTEGRHIEGLAKGHPDALAAYWHLTQTERDALVQAYKNMMRNEFTRRVVEKLLDTPNTEETISFKKGPLSKSQIINESLAVLNKSFEEAYDTMKYRASGRYGTGFTAQEIQPVSFKWKDEE